MRSTKMRAIARLGLLLPFLAIVSFPLLCAAQGNAESTHGINAKIDGEIALLSVPSTLSLSDSIELLNGCRKAGFAFKLCKIPQSITVSRGAPVGGLDPLFTQSGGTEVVVDARLETDGIGVDILVNGTRCSLSNGVTSCPVPVASGSDLNVDFFPSQSGETNLLTESVMRINSVTLRRGYEAVLLSLRAHADTLEASLTGDLAIYSRFDKQVRFQTTSRADLERVFASLTTEHIPPLPDFNKVTVGADGSESRNSECPLKPTPDPDTWSHTFEECGNLAIVTGLLNGDPVFSQADINETRARIEANGSSLGKIANALAANGEALDKRFQDLLARLRAKGIPLS